MFNRNPWQRLQLFAGEGGHADGCPAGEEGADAGHRRLRELGVPESRIRKSRSGEAAGLPEGALRSQPQQTAPNAQTEMPSRMQWEEILKDPEYNAQIQKIVKARLKSDAESRTILEQLSPALKQLARAHGMDPENMDYTALAGYITGSQPGKAAADAQPYEGVPGQQTQAQLQFRNHIRKLEQQGEALARVFPGFDLRAELRNPTFVRLTSPGVGMSVEDAFYAVHRKELQAQSMQVAAQQTASMISNAIRSGYHRPSETGTAAQAPSVSKFDYRNATPAQRQALKDQIRRAAAEGRKLYPG